MKKSFILVVWLVIGWSAGKVQAASLLFEYTGTVKTVGGSVLDGSLLGVVVSPGDAVSGCFVFESASPPGRTPVGMYQESVTDFKFGPFSAEGTQPNHSYMQIRPEFGDINAYKQVGTGSIYDNFGFTITVPGASWLTSGKPVNLLKVNELDPQQFNWTSTNFFLERVDIASNPLRYVIVTVSIDLVRAAPGTSCVASSAAAIPLDALAR